jgi:hypothetical protein
MIQPTPLETPCIEWTGTRHEQGYGRFIVDGKTVSAHRSAYCDMHGIKLSEIDGKVIRHKCDNPPCVNPDHLEIGTQADNIRDCELRGRARHPACEGNGRAKLNLDQVRQIRAMYVRGSSEFGARSLAKRFGMHKSTMDGIVNGVNWKFET